MSTSVAVASVLLLVLLFLKVPVFVSVMGGSITYFLLTPSTNPIIFAQRIIGGTESISLLAIPFFICAGVFMNYTGVTSRIMNFCEVMTGRMNGGLAQVNILLSTLMGGLSGSNLADAAMQSKMLVPEMEAKGYSKAFSTVLTASSSMITPLIPPGIAMILYGCIANVSIGRLFISGIGVGAMLCISQMMLVSLISRKRGYLPIRNRSLSLGEIGDAVRPAFFPLCLPIVIIGGIRLGVFTATEAGSVAIIYAILLGLFYGEMHFRDVKKALKETVTTTAAIMMIVASASAFSWILTREQIPQHLTEWMVSTIRNKYTFLFIVNIFLLVVGMFVEGNASMIVLVPLLAPIAARYGINEIHFAMVYIFNNAIGAFSPPMGTLMFVTCSITGCKTKDFIKEALPFYALLVVCLFLLTYVPWFTTWLINILY